MQIATTQTDRGTKVEIFVNGEKVESARIFQCDEIFYISDDIDCVEFESYEEALRMLKSRVLSEELQDVEEAIKNSGTYGDCIVSAYNNAHPSTQLRFLKEAKKYIGKTDFSTFISAHYIQNITFITRMING